MIDASSMSIKNICAMQVFIFAIHKLLAMLFLLAHSSLDILPPVLIVIWYFLAASCFNPPMFLWSPHRCMASCGRHELPLQVFSWTMFLELHPLSSSCARRQWLLEPIPYFKSYHRKSYKCCVTLSRCSPIQVHS